MLNNLYDFVNKIFYLFTQFLIYRIKFLGIMKIMRDFFIKICDPEIAGEGKF